MLIFLAVLAVLLIVAMLGHRAGTHLFHDGGARYLDHCAFCGKSYPRLPGVARPACPRGHPLAWAVAEPHHRSMAGTVFMALCAGFALAVLVLTVTGITPVP